LTDLVALDVLEEILNQYPTDDERAVRTMWATAMNAGGRDNITVVLACREVADRRTSAYSEDMP
jgi:serine/threonine protein phosphatase PrpC